MNVVEKYGTISSTKFLPCQWMVYFLGSQIECSLINISFRLFEHATFC